MELTIEGKVKQVQSIKSGTGANGEWKFQDVVIATEGQYSNNVCLTLPTKHVDTVNTGDKIKASFNVSSKEHNGRWFTNLSVWKLEKI